MLKIILFKKKFFKKVWNRIDLVFFIMSLIAFLINQTTSYKSQFDGYVVLSHIFYVIRVFRIVKISKAIT